MKIGNNNIGDNKNFLATNNEKHIPITIDKQKDLGVIIQYFHYIT